MTRLVIHRTNGGNPERACTCRPDNRRRSGPVFEAGRCIARSFAQDFLEGRRAVALSGLMAKHQSKKSPATYMRGGTSKGVFFRFLDEPARARKNPGRPGTTC